jgi:hypothetical protein
MVGSTWRRGDDGSEEGTEWRNVVGFGRTRLHSRAMILEARVEAGDGNGDLGSGLAWWVGGTVSRAHALYACGESREGGC